MQNMAKMMNFQISFFEATIHSMYVVVVSSACKADVEALYVSVEPKRLLLCCGVFVKFRLK